MNGIDDFFAKYEEGANSFDPDLLASQYTDCFMAAGPHGTACIQNDSKWKEAARKREQMFRAIGFKSAKILGKEVVELDRNYAMVKIHWHMKFDNPSAKQSEFKFFSTYCVCAVENDLKIAFYISHDDEQKVMEEAGLVPRDPA